MTLQTFQNDFSNEKRLCRLCKTVFRTKKEIARRAKRFFERKKKLPGGRNDFSNEKSKITSVRYKSYLSSCGKPPKKKYKNTSKDTELSEVKREVKAEVDSLCSWKLKWTIPYHQHHKRPARSA